MKPDWNVYNKLFDIKWLNASYIADNLLHLTRLLVDDTSLSYSSQSPYAIEDVMNSDLESISIWFKQWLVNFNPQKTKAMVFFNINIPNDVEIAFNTYLSFRRAHNLWLADLIILTIWVWNFPFVKSNT
jgi:hypothetical protein